MIEIHEAAEIMPLDEASIPELAEDIRKNGLLTPIERMGSYLEALEEIYNYKRTSTHLVPLKLEAVRAMRDRSATSLDAGRGKRAAKPSPGRGDETTRRPGSPEGPGRGGARRVRTQPVGIHPHTGHTAPPGAAAKT